MHVLVVLLHACFSVVGPIPFLLAAIFFSVHPYIGSTTVLPDYDDDDDDEEFLTIGQIWTVSFSSRTKVSQTLQSVLTEKYFVCVLVVLLDAALLVLYLFYWPPFFSLGSSLYRKYYRTSRSKYLQNVFIY